MLRCSLVFFFFQAEDGIRYLVRSRGLGDVYKRQQMPGVHPANRSRANKRDVQCLHLHPALRVICPGSCLLYTSDAADERSSVDLGGRRIIQKKNERGPTVTKKLL